MRITLTKISTIRYISIIFSLLLLTGCKIYKFNEGTVDAEIKTVKVRMIENRARYINPQLSPTLSDKLRQKIVSQTRLTQTNNDNADWEISGTITDYTFSTSVISGQQSAATRLNVVVHIIKNDRKNEKTDEYDVNRSIELPGNQSFQQAEAANLGSIIQAITDEIFNKLFSNW